MLTARDTVNAYMRRRAAGETLPPMLVRLCQFHCLCVLGRWLIRTEDEQIRPLYPNESQYRLLAKVMSQAERRRPIRIRVGKARKTGISTYVQAMAASLCAYNPNVEAITIAHEGGQTEVIFEIARRAATQHRYADCHPAVLPADSISREIRFHDSGSVYRCQTAGSSGLSAGSTPTVVHFSERPKWERNARETFVSTMNALPRTETSMAIDEATFQGREDFWSDFEHGNAGDPNYQWESLFIPWYVDDRLRSVVPDDFSMADDELRIIRRAHGDGIELAYGALQWRREKIAEIGEGMFRQEYPSTAEEAVQATEGLILRNMRDCLIDALPFDPQYCPHYERVGGIDFGYHDPTVILTGYYRDQTLYLTACGRGVETLADEQATWLADGHTYFCDPSGVQARQELVKAAHLQKRKVTLIAAPRKRSTGEDFSTAELNAVVRLAETGKLKILRDVSRQLLIECDSFCWNERTGKPDETRGKEFGHFDTIRALQYLVMGAVRRITTPPIRDRVPSIRMGMGR